MAEAGKQKALDTTLANLKKRFGEGTVMKLGETERLKVGVIPTGSLSLDLALGVGGVPRGRITEIYGPEASGKTTICQHIIAEAQKTGGIAAFVDVEHALDPAYAARCGVNVDDLYISQPDTGEQALEIAEALVRSGAMDVVVIDSVAALVPRAEIEGEMGDSHMGLQARLMSQALRKLVGAINTSNTALIFTNQLRQKIGVMFGNPETTTGGMALKFYASVRLDVRRHREHQTGRANRRQPHACDGQEEQGRAALPPGRVRHHVQRGHQQGRRHAGPGRDDEIVEKRGAFYSLRRHAPRPGPRERQGIPGELARRSPTHRGGHPREIRVCPLWRASWWRRTTPKTRVEPPHIREWLRSHGRAHGAIDYSSLANRYAARGVGTEGAWETIWFTDRPIT